MASRSTSRICGELLATLGKLYWHALGPVWNARARSGDLLSRGARRRHGARVQRVRGIRQLFGASHLAWCFLSPLFDPRFPFHFRIIALSKLFDYGHSWGMPAWRRDRLRKRIGLRESSLSLTVILCAGAKTLQVRRWRWWPAKGQ